MSIYSDYWSNNRITEATEEDLQDFWYPTEKVGSWYPEDFDPNIHSYARNVLGMNQYPPSFKRESRLSE